ncbi:hypothetical protein EX30DRAFT_349251 [Ascodesmis nigricans]|uniref:Uncharacterized protein n=1 Tax=Ascodesmis nigricans TaxID=341454 RepID=A0A4S2MVV6_9PEZI|nr:hypothetical protein EX30DRAFT_349251 [Ascodesmis nigricans]
MQTAWLNTACVPRPVGGSGCGGAINVQNTAATRPAHSALAPASKLRASPFRQGPLLRTITSREFLEAQLWSGHHGGMLVPPMLHPTTHPEGSLLLRGDSACWPSWLHATGHTLLSFCWLADEHALPRGRSWYSFLCGASKHKQAFGPSSASRRPHPRGSSDAATFDETDLMIPLNNAHCIQLHTELGQAASSDNEQGLSQLSAKTVELANIPALSLSNEPIPNSEFDFTVLQPELWQQPAPDFSVNQTSGPPGFGLDSYNPFYYHWS